MGTGEAASSLSNKIRDTAKDAQTQLRAAGETVADGMRQGVNYASDAVREGSEQASGAINTMATGASSAGKDAYRILAEKTGDTLAGVDRAVARNPVGALVAALGIGLVFGLLARK